MLDKQDLQAIAQLMADQETRLTQMMAEQETRLIKRIDDQGTQLTQKMADQETRLTQKMADQETRLTQMMAEQETRLTQMMDTKVAEIKDYTLDRLIEQEERVHDQIEGVKIIIENDVAKRINVLFDGYKLNHEKQFELEDKVLQLERRLERLEQKII